MGNLTEQEMNRDVYSHKDSDVYHLHRRRYPGVTKCGWLLLKRDLLETGVIEREPRKSAMKKGLRACRRCFPGADRS